MVSFFSHFILKSYIYKNAILYIHAVVIKAHIYLVKYLSSQNMHFALRILDVHGIKENTDFIALIPLRNGHRLGEMGRSVQCIILLCLDTVDVWTIRRVTTNLEHCIKSSKIDSRDCVVLNVKIWISFRKREKGPFNN